MATKQKEAQVVDLREKMALIATDKAPYHKKDEKFYAHPILGNQFIKAGIAKPAASNEE